MSIKNSSVQDFLERTAKTHGISSPMWIGATLLNEVNSGNQSVPLWRTVCGKAYSILKTFSNSLHFVNAKLYGSPLYTYACACDYTFVQSEKRRALQNLLKCHLG